MKAIAYSVRRGISLPVIILAIVTLLLLGSGTFFVLKRGSSTPAIDPILATVTEGEFVSQVLDQGEVQSSENIEIRCQVQARNGQISVLEIVAEGSNVKPGDFLVRLDATSFEKELEQQKVSVANAQTSVIQSKASYDAALVTKKEYEEGLYIQEQKTIQNEKFDAIASENSALQELEQAKAVLEHSKTLFAKGYTNKQQLDADEFAVERAKTNLEKARNSIDMAESKLTILEKYTKEKELVRLNSDIEAAKVKYSNDEEALKVEVQKQNDIVKQIENCTINVPDGVEGQVVYAKESSRGGTEWVLEEGASVRENQVLMRLPNPKKMEVKALINEQSITLIKIGMPCAVRVDALNNQVLKGYVTKVNQYAENSGWMSSSIRKYAVLVQILTPPPELKPGMNASVTIQTMYEPKVVLAPLQAVYGVQGQHFCLVKKADDKYETRSIKVKADNSQVVWVESGLDIGEELVMNPGAFKEYMELPDIVSETKIEIPEEAQAAAAERAQSAPGENGGGPENGEGGRRRGQGGPGGGFDPSAMLDRMFDRYDTNGDGKIDAQEISSVSGRGADMLSGADGNGDGEITKDELSKAAEKMMQGGGFGGGGPGGGGGRGPGGGRGGFGGPGGGGQ
ncbi:MAG: HlyD family efflux transporter periplasmic adaptor subunit [Pirellulaceae bacterium]